MREIEEVLLYYGNGIFQKQANEIQVAINDVKDISEVKTSSTSSFINKGTYTDTSVVERCVLQNHDKYRLERQYNNLIKLIKKLDEGVDLLPKSQKQIVELRYFTGMKPMPFIEVSSEVGQSENWCAKLNMKALSHMENIIYGVKIEWGNQ